MAGYFNLPFSVRISNSDPIDGDRYIANDISQRDQLIIDGRADVGQQVFVTGSASLYVLEQLTPTVIWTEVGNSKELIEGTGITLTETTSSIEIASSVGMAQTDKFTAIGGENSYDLSEEVDDRYKYQVFINGVLQKEGAGADYTFTYTSGSNTTVNFETPLIVSDFLDVYYNQTDIQGPIQSGLQNIVEDLSPELGGQLDALTNNIININELHATTLYGDGSNLTGVTSYTDSDNLIYLNSLNVVSGSSQIDHNLTTNYTSSEHIDWTIDQGSTNIHIGNYDNTWRRLGVFHHPVPDFIDDDVSVVFFAGTDIFINADNSSGNITIGHNSGMYHMTSNENDAMYGANSPSSTNTLATMDDLLTFSDSSEVGTKQNNYELARDLQFNYKNGNQQEVIIAALDDLVGGGFHGLRYVEKYKTLFGVDRTNSGSVYAFTDTDDLGSYDTADISIDGYVSSDQIIYSPEKEKLYCVLSDSTWSVLNFKVQEIDPITLSVTTVIDYNIGTYIGYPTFNVIGTDLFIANGAYSGKVYKFDLTDYSFTDVSLALGASAGPHGMTTDGEKLYISSIWDYGATYIARINPSDLVIEQIHEFDVEGTNASAGMTDDIILVGDYLYAPSEVHDNTGLWKFDKRDLTKKVKFDVPKASPSSSLWAVHFDGIDIWYAGDDNLLGKINPTTLESYTYENPFSYNLNELTTDGQTFFVAGFDSYPVTGTGFIGKFTTPSTVTKKRVFKTDGTILYDTDYESGTIENTILTNIEATGSFSGSFYGDGTNLSGVTSYTDADTLAYINSQNVISGSSQLDDTSIDNLTVTNGIFDGDITTTTLKIDESNYSTALSPTINSSTATVALIPTGSCDAIFFDYTVKQGLNVRAGTLITVHNGVETNVVDNTTTDIGNTDPITLTTDISGENIRLRATATTDGWVVKSMVRTI